MRGSTSGLRAGKAIRRRIRPSCGVRLRQGRAAPEKELQKINCVGYVEDPVVVSVGAVLAPQRSSAKKERPEDGDGIRYVDEAVEVRVTAYEDRLASRAKEARARAHEGHPGGPRPAAEVVGG